MTCCGFCTVLFQRFYLFSIDQSYSSWAELDQYEVCGGSRRLFVIVESLSRYALALLELGWALTIVIIES